VSGPGLRREAGVLTRFGLAGLVNTAVGLAVILGLELGLGVERHLANALGYAVGFLVGYQLHRGFVFKGHDGQRGLKVRYAAALAIAFAVNQGVLTLGALAAPPDDLGRTLAQLGGLASYTGTQFLLMRLWVFRSRS
jgi:putative flippase GtrA